MARIITTGLEGRVDPQSLSTVGDAAVQTRASRQANQPDRWQTMGNWAKTADAVAASPAVGLAANALGDVYDYGKEKVEDYQLKAGLLETEATEARRLREAAARQLATKARLEAQQAELHAGKGQGAVGESLASRQAEIARLREQGLASHQTPEQVAEQGLRTPQLDQQAEWTQAQIDMRKPGTMPGVATPREPLYSPEEKKQQALAFSGAYKQLLDRELAAVEEAKTATPERAQALLDEAEALRAKRATLPAAPAGYMGETVQQPSTATESYSTPTPVAPPVSKGFTLQTTNKGTSTDPVYQVVDATGKPVYETKQIKNAQDALGNANTTGKAEPPGGYQRGIYRGQFAIGDMEGNIVWKGDDKAEAEAQLARLRSEAQAKVQAETQAKVSAPIPSTPKEVYLAETQRGKGDDVVSAQTVEADKVAALGSAQRQAEGRAAQAAMPARLSAQDAEAEALRQRQEKAQADARAQADADFAAFKAQTDRFAVKPPRAYRDDKGNIQIERSVNPKVTDIVALARGANTLEKQALVMQLASRVDLPYSSLVERFGSNYQLKFAREIETLFPQAPKDSPELIAAKAALQFAKAGTEYGKFGQGEKKIELQAERGAQQAREGERKEQAGDFGRAMRQDEAQTKAVEAGQSIALRRATLGLHGQALADRRAENKANREDKKVEKEEKKEEKKAEAAKEESKEQKTEREKAEKVLRDHVKDLEDKANKKASGTKEKAAQGRAQKELTTNPETGETGTMDNPAKGSPLDLKRRLDKEAQKKAVPVSALQRAAQARLRMV